MRKKEIYAEGTQCVCLCVCTTHYNAFVCFTFVNGVLLCLSFRHAYDDDDDEDGIHALHALCVDKQSGALEGEKSHPRRSHFSRKY